MCGTVHYQLDANGEASITAADIDGGSTDNCGVASLEIFADATNEILINGSFENGNLSGWTAINNPNPFLPWGAYNQIDGQGFFSPALPTDGAWLAGNGFDGGSGEAILFQDVTIPSGVSASLSWDENIDYNLSDFCFGCLNRIYEVQIRDLSNNVLQVIQQVDAIAGTTDNDNIWESLNIDLSAYAGQDVRIAFWQNIPQNSTGPAKFALDNVSSK